MPLYFVDFQDGRDLHYDAEGYEFEGFQEACKQALVALKEIAKDRPGNHRRHEVIVTIRNEAEASLYKATLKLYGRRCSVAIWPEAWVRSSHRSSELPTVQEDTEASISGKY